MILYFSGTGNSEYVAKRISLEIEDDAINVFDMIRKTYGGSDITCFGGKSEKPIVVVSPVYAWQLPHFLRDWLLRVLPSIEGSEDVYFVLTCGDTLGTAWKYARKICEASSKHFMGMGKVIMPENYIALFDAPEDREAAEIIRRAEPVIYRIAELIGKGQPLSYEKEVFGGFLSTVINPFFYKLYVKDKAFRTTEACTSCGLCEKLCPLANIELEEGKPVWKGNCTHCMACICHCPEEAIEYGKKSIGRVRYVCRAEAGEKD